jgi:hypothetical protein
MHQELVVGVARALVQMAASFRLATMVIFVKVLHALVAQQGHATDAQEFGQSAKLCAARETQTPSLPQPVDPQLRVLLAIMWLKMLQGLVVGVVRALALMAASFRLATMVIFVKVLLVLVAQREHVIDAPDLGLSAKWYALRQLVDVA